MYRYNILARINYAQRGSPEAAQAELVMGDPIRIDYRAPEPKPGRIRWRLLLVLAILIPVILFVLLYILIAANILQP